LLRGAPDTEAEDAALAAIGLVRVDRPDTTCELWPENEPAVDLFCAVLTQWQMGPGGPVGLRYEALPVVLDLHQVPAGERRERFEQLRVMECEALRWFGEQARQRR
jgi:hypothetical protein